MRVRLLAGLAAGLLLLLVIPAVANEAVPPDRNDPCSTGGKNTCGTLGVGFHKVYRYGLRWFGDFRGAIPGEKQTFCIDLRFWYPSSSYRYREGSGGSLVNRDGDAVSAERQQRMAYAVWAFGRTNDANQQAAVMLYVHALMGDGRPGEVDPDALNPAVASLYARVQHEASLYHGPYRIEFRPAGTLSAGKAATATLRVLSAAGNALPGVTVTVSGEGVGNLSTKVRTGSNGTATVAFTPAAATIRLTARTEDLASTLPRVFTPSVTAAAVNGQRLVAPGSQQVAITLEASALKSQIAVSTVATPAVLAAGETSTDRVTISGAAPGWRAKLAVRIHGPFASAAQIRCDGTPAWTGTLLARANGTFTTPPARLTRAGWYGYEIAVPGDGTTLGVTTACGVAAESFKVQAVPKLTTAVSAQRVGIGTPVFDKVRVAGLGGLPVSVQAALYGPFATRETINCRDQLVWSGTLDITADGEIQAGNFVPAASGYYTYQEQIAAGDLVRAAQTVCGDPAETVLVVARPQITTEVSSRQVKTGATVFDRVTVRGLGGLAVPMRIELWGPFATAQTARCSGTPYRVQTLTVAGDGTYATTPVVLAKAGYYTYRAAVAAGALNDAVAASCGESTETALAADTPPPPTTTTPTKTTESVTPSPAKTPVLTPLKSSLTTIVSQQVVRPGASIYDRIQVKGIRGSVQVQLFGPYATRAAIDCSGPAAWAGRVTITRDGEIRSPSVRVARAGFYVFRERVLGPSGPTLTTACAIEAETSLVAPEILTGRGEQPAHVRAARTGSAMPVRLRLASLGIDAPVAPVGVDIALGTLGVPSSIRQVGWWRDGAAPGSASGTVLIAGHVDSAKAGAGAFFRLHEAKAGTGVQLTTAAGRTLAYRVVSVQRYPKRALPIGIWTREGPARLVLVTCGGPFDRAIGRYRDNVVVTAVPA